MGVKTVPVAFLVQSWVYSVHNGAFIIQLKESTMDNQLFQKTYSMIDWIWSRCEIRFTTHFIKVKANGPMSVSHSVILQNSFVNVIFKIKPLLFRFTKHVWRYQFGFVNWSPIKSLTWKIFRTVILKIISWNLPLSEVKVHQYDLCKFTLKSAVRLITVWVIWTHRTPWCRTKF